MGCVLIRIVEHLRVREERVKSTGLRHVLVIEEAHRLLKNGSTGQAAAAVELFASLLAEVRAYGEGVVVVEQIPSKIVPDVLKNTALEVMHRLPARDDRDAVGSSMNLQEADHESVVALPPGVAAVSFDGADRPLLLRMTNGLDSESADGCVKTPPLLGRRSGSCGELCLETACELRVVAAAATTAEEPVIVLWAEAVAASMIMGLAPPAPRPPVVGLWPEGARHQQCAVADPRRPGHRRATTIHPTVGGPGRLRAPNARGARGRIGRSLGIAARRRDRPLARRTLAVARRTARAGQSN